MILFIMRDDSNRVVPRKSAFSSLATAVNRDEKALLFAFVEEEKCVSIQRPRGTADILPGEVEAWQRLENIVRSVFSEAHYQEIRTPIFEHTELFERGVGETTDIVEKEMYTFVDRGDRSVTLRPEGTAGVTRAYVENKLYGQPGASKLFYIGPMFRYEKPQKGRWRQFHQYGCEVLGADGSAIDAEVIGVNLDILKNLGLKNLLVELNSVGCSNCRPVHRETMIEKLLPFREKLCSDCQGRLERNPLRIFDCKHESCQAILKESNVPTMLDTLCEDCKQHFAGVQEYLQGMKVPFVINNHLVRGLDYYTRTAWEITSEGYSTISGGGRYNSLVREVGGPETPGIGFAGGIERALLVLAEQTGGIDLASALDVFVAVADQSAEIKAMSVMQTLRHAGIRTDRDYQGKSMKAQFKAADRDKAKFVLVLGESEIASETVTLKHLATGEQVNLDLESAISRICKEKSLSWRG
jgi:histidyl-tRNA synthetase